MYGEKGQAFQSYTEESKVKAIQTCLTGVEGCKVVAERLGITNCTLLKVWVKKYRNGKPFDTCKSVTNPMKGRLRTTFARIEEERDYLKAQVDYLKSGIPNACIESFFSHLKTEKLYLQQVSQKQRFIKLLRCTSTSITTNVSKGN